MHSPPEAGGRGSSVLVVESNARAREWEAAWLEEAGFDVTVCPGPSAPDYRCIGGRSDSCPLASGADLIVLDLTLAGDAAGEGTRAWELLLMYNGFGKPTVVIAGGDEPFVPTPDERVAVIERPVRREALVRAVRSMLTTV
jgi:CheY-like chemotaxis protein